MKQMRFYARFIVTCLLLNKKSLIDVLVHELNDVVREYSNSVRDESQTQKWHFALQEITLFLQADIFVTNESSQSGSSRRCKFNWKNNPEFTMISLESHNSYILDKCILVSSKKNQVKFSELTLDVYRLILSLEREIVLDNKIKEEPSSKRKSNQNSNPKKYLLYRPTVSELIWNLASVQKEMSSNSVMLLYFSVDNITNKNEGDFSKNDNSAIYLRSEEKNLFHNSHTLSHKGFYPQDLFTFMRKPLLLILDCKTSVDWINIKNTSFGAPFITLSSPNKYPPDLLEPSQSGSLFTWFLHDPLSALLFTFSKTKNHNHNQIISNIDLIFSKLHYFILKSVDKCTLRCLQKK